MRSRCRSHPGRPICRLSTPSLACHDWRRIRTVDSRSSTRCHRRELDANWRAASHTGPSTAEMAVATVVEVKVVVRAVAAAWGAEVD